MTFDSSFYSGAIKCFVYPSANQILLLQERTGHLGAQPVETHVYPNCFFSSLSFCFVLHFELLSGLPLYTSSQSPVPCSPFPVLVTSYGEQRQFLCREGLSRRSASCCTSQSDFNRKPTTAVSSGRSNQTQSSTAESPLVQDVFNMFKSYLEVKLEEKGKQIYGKSETDKQVGQL